MKSILFLLPALWATSPLFSQGCPSPNMSFTSQSQVNDFPVLYPECISLNNVTISGPDITSLAPLQQLQTIGNALKVNNNPILTSLAGLHGINDYSINILELINNPVLQDLAGLGQFEELGTFYVYNTNLSNFNGLPSTLWQIQNFTIASNLNLQSFMGLENINHVASLLLISGNPRIHNFNGFDSLGGTGNLYISLDSIENFEGLERLQSTQNLTILSCPSLQTMDGFDSLFHITNLSISDCSRLTETDGIPLLTQISGNLTINANDSLESIVFPDSIEIIGNVELTNNPMLDACCFLVDTDIGGEIILENNAPECSSLLAVQFECDPDGDGLVDDNCPNAFNPQQQDYDDDGFGNPCDNCPTQSNPTQADSNHNFIGDICEIPESGKIGLTTTNPKSQLEISGGDIYVSNSQRGLILRDFLNQCYRLYVDEYGRLNTVLINCPD